MQDLTRLSLHQGGSVSRQEHLPARPSSELPGQPDRQRRWHGCGVVSGPQELVSALFATSISRVMSYRMSMQHPVIGDRVSAFEFVNDGWQSHSLLQQTSTLLWRRSLQRPAKSFRRGSTRVNLNFWRPLLFGFELGMSPCRPSFLQDGLER